jgi:hypothetical protein
MVSLSNCLLTHTELLLGFAVVGEYEDPAIKAAQAEAFQDMVSWLSSH